MLQHIRSIGIPPALACDSTSLSVLLVLLALSLLAARKMFGSSPDPREPPLAPQSIPVVGHLIGLSRSKFNYYVDLRSVPPLQLIACLVAIPAA